MFSIRVSLCRLCAGIRFDVFASQECTKCARVCVREKERGESSGRAMFVYGVRALNFYVDTRDECLKIAEEVIVVLPLFARKKFRLEAATLKGSSPFRMWRRLFHFTNAPLPLSSESKFLF